MPFPMVAMPLTVRPMAWLRPRSGRAILLIAVLALLAACAQRPTADERVETAPVWLPRHPDTAFRMLVWNVSRASFFREQETARALLSAAAADLLLLDEMPGTTSEALIAAALPARPDGWQVIYGVGGGAFERASIASTFDLQRVDAFDRLPYSDALVASWLGQAPERLQPRLIADLPAGVAAVGATLTVQGRRLLVVGLDLQCCGDTPESWEEEKRQVEAGAIRDAVLARFASGGLDAVLVAGDVNNVQGDQPLKILRGELDGELALDEVVPARRLSDATWTWDGRGTPFASKQLDHVLHSAALLPLQARILDSEDMDAAELAALGLAAGSSATVSAHRPIVVDFGWR